MKKKKKNKERETVKQMEDRFEIEEKQQVMCDRERDRQKERKNERGREKDREIEGKK